MDVSRAVLDNLMGRDRNKLLDNVTERDHYSNPDVCKSFLVCFCFNTLFPNTTYDQGPCQKRHDTYLKNMFDSDPNRAQYERQYIRECIHWIQRRLQEVQKKTKQNQSVIDNKSNFPTDRPKQILDRILAIQADIQKLIKDSQKYGQEGKIDDSLRCLEEVEKLRDRRKQIELMGSDMSNAQKQQKICVICGAIQTINDTQKRIQTHLQGKIHQGFLKLRHQVETLKIRLEVLNKINPPERKERQQYQRKRQRQRQQRQKQQKQRQQRQRQEQERRRQELERRRQKEKQQAQKKTQRLKESELHRNAQIRSQRKQRQPRDRSDSAGRRKKKQRSKERQRSRQRRDRHEDREKTKQVRQKDRHSRSKDRKQKKHHRDSQERDNKERSHKDHKESKQHKKKHKKNRSRSKERNYLDER